jgi:glutamate-1-semialdehyde 2,1-aminomutase
MVAQTGRDQRIAEFRAPWEREFRDRAPQSRELFESAASRRIPDGQRFYYSSGLPHPLYLDRAHGAHVVDVDGNRYLDLIAGWNSAVLGFGNAAIVEAVSAAMRRYGGTAGEPLPARTRERLVELIVERVPGAERVFFCLTGADASAYAIRVARAYTGRDKILKFVGAYHGVYDDMLVGSFSMAGAPANTAENVILARFNDHEATARLIADHAAELAAVITEPIMTSAGNLHQREDFLQFLRDETLRHGVLLICDEAITGFRFARGGAIERYGITPAPDLIPLAKNLGGGLPVGALAGSAEVMSAGIVAQNSQAINPICHAAAIACLEQLTPEVYERMDAMGAALRAGLRSACADVGFDIQVTGDSTNSGVHMTNRDVRSAEDVREADQALFELLRLGMVNRRMNWSSRGIGVSAAMTPDDVDEVVAAFEDTLLAMRSLVAEVSPALLV